MRSSSSQRILLLSLGCLIALPGCSSGPRQVPVSGKITVNGRPLTEGRITFLPANDNRNELVPYGSVNKDGEYVLHTNGKLGAPLGQYKVIIQIPSEFESAPGKKRQGPLPKRLIHPKFSNAALTPLQVTVEESAQPGAYDFIVTGP
jgi:hypothetical protein